MAFGMDFSLSEFKKRALCSCLWPKDQISCKMSRGRNTEVGQRCRHVCLCLCLLFDGNDTGFNSLQFVMARPRSVDAVDEAA